MWLQTSKNSVAGVVRLVLLVLTATVLLAGCGYQFAGKEKGIFGDPRSTIRMGSVENPTMYAWLPPKIRSLMRDEIHKRNLASWVDSSPSDYTMRIVIDEFMLRSHMRDSDDKTLIYSASLRFEAIVYSGQTNRVFWRSGKESLSRTYDSKNEQDAGTDITQLLVQRVCDRMRHSF
ncbi:LPS assembly lipoprotein LptE [Desulfovibrio mangrovi]|uniref:LPS assembly lipoprotein LptE n=1 Tax=Desulfovibrio mangrovi TaxID=2976983 RepID=UPI00224722D8|nr:LPS assembly lipoprotein LptE [Desulfovibrio mangrovi]UZP67750.1 LPS assembly lipoprotein LptE [Desulfovibrio mangrovi]